MIINAGIRRVVYAGHYPDENAVAFMREAGVALESCCEAEATGEPYALGQADEGNQGLMTDILGMPEGFLVGRGDGSSPERRRQL